MLVCEFQTVSSYFIVLRILHIVKRYVNLVKKYIFRCVCVSVRAFLRACVCEFSVVSHQSYNKESVLRLMQGFTTCINSPLVPR